MASEFRKSDLIATTFSLVLIFHFLGSRQKRQFPTGFMGNSGLGFGTGFFDRPFFDAAFFDDLPSIPFFNRAPRKTKSKPQRGRGRGRVPVYPPFDPFGNTEYIKVGPSNPSHALPLASGNPHFQKHGNFRRPFFFRNK